MVAEMALVELRLLQAGVPYSALEKADPRRVWRWYAVLGWVNKRDREEQERSQAVWAANARSAGA